MSGDAGPEAHHVIRNEIEGGSQYTHTRTWCYAKRTLIPRQPTISIERGAGLVQAIPIIEDQVQGDDVSWKSTKSGTRCALPQ
jgi:hypothetical protein